MRNLIKRKEYERYLDLRQNILTRKMREGAGVNLLMLIKANISGK